MKELIAKVWPSFVITNVTFWFLILASIVIAGCGEREIRPMNKSRFFVQDSLTYVEQDTTICDVEKSMCYSSKSQMQKLVVNMRDNHVAFIWDKLLEISKEERERQLSQGRAIAKWVNNVKN